MAKRTVDALGEEGHRKQTDSLGEVEVPADKLWGAQTQRSLDHFSIGRDLMPREMITAYAILKRASANANYAGKRLGEEQHRFNIEACDEILAGQHHDMFPSHVWVTGSGTQSIKRGLNPRRLSLFGRIAVVAARKINDVAQPRLGARPDRFQPATGPPARVR